MAGEPVGTNLPTYQLNGTSVTARAAEVTAADFAGGMNKGGSCAGGIGLNTGNIDPKLTDWSILDQAGAARSPQDSQHIGGDGLGDGDQTNNPLQAIDGADINDTLSYSVADANAAVDAEYDTSTGAINKTGAAVVIGDVLWGLIPVA